MNDFAGKLLLDERPLIVLPSLAKALGDLNHAIFLQQLHYLLVWYKNDPAHLRDGRVWVWNSYKQWYEYFGIWSPATTRRVIEALEGDKVILSSTQYNVAKYDNCKWYTIDYETLSSLLDSTRGVLNLSIPLAQSEQGSLLNLSKDINTKNSLRSPKENNIIDSDVSFRKHNLDFENFAAGIWGREYTTMGWIIKCDLMKLTPNEMLLREAMVIAAKAGPQAKSFRFVQGVLKKMQESEKRFQALKGNKTTESGATWISYCGQEMPEAQQWEHKQGCEKCMAESKRLIEEAASSALAEMKGVRR